MAANTGGGGGGSSAAIRAGQAFVEIFTKDDGLRAGLARAKAMVASAGAFLSKAGLGMVAAGAVGLTALGGLAATAVHDNVAVLDLADKFGLTTEKLSSFAYAVKGAGLELEDVDKLFEKLDENLTSAANGGEEASLALAKLGLNPQQLKSLDQVDRVLTVMDKLKGVAAGDRLDLENKLLGNKGQDLNRAVTRMGSGGIRGKMGEAGAAGAEIDGMTAEKAKAFESAWTTAWTSVRSIIRSVGEALFPTITGVENMTQQFLNGGQVVRSWIQDNQRLITIAVGVAAGLVALGAIFIAGGTALSFIATAAGGFISMLLAVKAVVLGAAGFLTAGLLTPIIAIPALLIAAGVAFLAFTEEGRSYVQDLVDGIKEMFSDTVANITASWKAIVGAIGRGDFEMAFKIGVGAIKLEWARGVLWITDYWNRFKDLFLDGWVKLVEKFTDIWAAGVDTTASSLVWLAEKAGIYSKTEAEQIRATMDQMAQEEAQARNRARIERARGAKEAREGDLAGAREDLKNAEKAQQDLLEKNAELQAAADAAEKAKQEEIKNNKDKGGPSAAATLAVRGAYAGSGSLGQFFAGGQVGQLEVAKKNLAELGKQTDILIQIRDGLPKSGLKFSGGTA